MGLFAALEAESQVSSLVAPKFWGGSLPVDEGTIYEAEDGTLPYNVACMDIEQKRQALGSAIRERRLEQGLSQERLALMVGSSKSHIWRIETGRVGVGIDDLARIADALNTEVRKLLCF